MGTLDWQGRAAARPGGAAAAPYLYPGSKHFRDCRMSSSFAKHSARGAQLRLNGERPPRRRLEMHGQSSDAGFQA